MNQRLALSAVCALTGLAIAAALYSRRAAAPPERHASSTPRAAEPEAAPATVSAAASPVGRAAATPVPGDPLVTAIEDLWNRLSAGKVGAAALAEFRKALLGSDPKQAIEAIRSFLATGRDAPTGEAFQVGEGGALAGAPSLRVLLMDLLGQLDAQTGGSEAAQVARAVLNTKSSADEWAVSLRNVGQHEPAATAYLSGKAREMLSYEPWRSAPTAGYLEAFDVPVFTADASFVSNLSELARSGPDAARRAATIAMDRLSEANPLAVMGQLNSNPTEFADRPFLRADYFGKADLSDAQQRQAVEFYLGRGDVSLEEKAKVLASLASPASIITDALLSPAAVRPESPQREAAVPVTLTKWKSEERFSGLRPLIEQTLVQLAQ